MDVVLTGLLLDPYDTAVTYETASALLRREDIHAFRLVLTALGEGDADQADEIMSAICHAYGNAEKWKVAWQRCEALTTDPDERVRCGAGSVLGLRLPPAAGPI